jgi:hypothetical protein
MAGVIRLKQPIKPGFGISWAASLIAWIQISQRWIEYGTRELKASSAEFIQQGSTAWPSKTGFASWQ